MAAIYFDLGLTQINQQLINLVRINLVFFYFLLEIIKGAICNNEDINY